MKISNVLPIALSTLLTASLAAPLALRYPSPAETEKRADTFLTLKGRPASFDQVIHHNLDFGSGEPLLIKKDTVPTAENKRAFGALTSPGEGRSSSSLDSAIHETLDFGGTTNPLMGSSGPSLTLFKRAMNAVKRASGALTSSGDSLSGSSFSSAIHEDLDFGGVTDPLLGNTGPSLTLFKKAVGNAAEKVATAFKA
ncbi:hypothetical protein G7Y79_00008g023980 [Physcia stellaris]|nr:hypothetical protein G7Y79_00008g023980 [Physcia stellaris]